MDDFAKDAFRYSTFSSHPKLDYDLAMGVAWHHWTIGNYNQVRSTLKFLSISPEFDLIEAYKAAERLRVKVAFNAPPVFEMTWEKV